MKESREEIVVGIDPGLSGAIGVLSYDTRSRFEAVYSIPTEEKKSGRRQIDVVTLCAILEEVFKGVKTGSIVIEQVSAMPGQGGSGMFSLGDSFGVLRAVATHYVSKRTQGSLYLVSPLKWKSSLGLILPKDQRKKGDEHRNQARKHMKGAALTLARRLFPPAREFLYRKKDEGRAEALLIAHYARTTLRW